MAVYAEKQKEKIKEIASRWQKNNKGKVNANTAIRHTAKMMRKPKWLTKEDKTHIRCLYQLSEMRSRSSGISWNVDHIVPLQGKNVSGLHVPWNLQVIPASANFRKNNRFHDNP
jgi:5-methylcytosine-specific restriction endonuclease McrA